MYPQLSLLPHPTPPHPPGSSLLLILPTGWTKSSQVIQSEVQALRLSAAERGGKQRKASASGHLHLGLDIRSKTPYNS